jgi:hypothetical protein
MTAAQEGHVRRFKVQPGTLISGAAMISFIDNANANDAAPIVKKHGFENVDPDKWYSLTDFHRFLYELEQRSAVTYNLIAIGIGVAHHAHMPPNMDSPDFAQMIERSSEHYQGNFRNGDVGHKEAIKLGPKHYKVVHEKTMMPDDLEYGVMYGFAKRFLPPGTPFTIWYDENVLRMDEGGDQTVIHVRWE